ncbi:hypothetical protein QQM79_09245 [Marinobacteraceae bacterium S3BR75-40.1]
MEYVSAISSMVMAAVWVIYFQIFFLQYRRQKRPFLVIHHAQGHDPDAACLLVNMSQNPVHVVCVTAYVETRDGDYTLQVTDYQRVTQNHSRVQDTLRQGPLGPGGHLLLGPFRDIILGHRSDDEPCDDADSLDEVKALELRVVVVHAPSTSLIGARRRFSIEKENGEHIIRASNIHTEQLIGRKKRHLVREWAEEHLQPQHRGPFESRTSSQDG